MKNTIKCPLILEIRETNTGVLKIIGYNKDCSSDYPLELVDLSEAVALKEENERLLQSVKDQRKRADDWLACVTDLRNTVEEQKQLMAEMYEALKDTYACIDTDNKNIRAKILQLVVKYNESIKNK